MGTAEGRKKSCICPPNNEMKGGGEKNKTKNKGDMPNITITNPIIFQDLLYCHLQFNVMTCNCRVTSKYS
jgi:hypothetical protein